MSKLHVDIVRTLPGFELNVHFDADENMLALLGASGSGKSMTLRCIAGIERPTEGVITLNDRVLFDSAAKINLPPQQRNVGYLFQSYALFSHMTVEQNIAVGLGKLPRSEKGAVIDEQVRLFQLSDLRHRYPKQLSGGQQQRVALARVMAYKPDVLMLDEPFSALDSYLRWQLEPQMLDILSQYDGVALYVSHNRDEAYRLCKSIAVMEGGRIVTKGEKKDVFKSPKTRAAAMITGCKNISAAKKTGKYSLYAVDWDMELTSSLPIPDDLSAVGVRAHDIHPSTHGEVNALALGNAQTSEAPFSVSVIIPTRRESLRWEIDRSLWEAQMRGSLPQVIAIDQDKLLFLTD